MKDAPQDVVGDTPYRPSSGTAGHAFWNKWCATCARDAVLNGTMGHEEAEAAGKLCPIVGKTMALDITDADYPKEWVRRAGVPTCTAYTEHVWPGELSEAERAAQRGLF